MDCSLDCSPVHGIFQARILEWVSIFTPGDLPCPEIKPASPVSSALAGKFFITEPPEKPIRKITNIYLAAIILSSILPEEVYLISEEVYEARIPNFTGRNGRPYNISNLLKIMHPMSLIIGIPSFKL